MTEIRLGNGNNIFGPVGASGVSLYGENGNDALLLGGEPATGEPTFTSAINCSVFGGNGNDTIQVIGHDNFIYGENGTDTITVSNVNNTVDGGNGSDHIIAKSFRDRFGSTYDTGALENHLNGGQGNDIIESYSSLPHGFKQQTVGITAEGSVMTGGNGGDSFIVRNNNDTFVADNNDGVVSSGDVIKGVIDEITDYTKNDRLDVGANTQSGPVTLEAVTHFYTQSDGGPVLQLTHTHLDLPSGSYGAFRCSITGAGEFTVSDSGPDLLVASDSSVVVLHGVTDSHQIWFA